MLLSVCLLIPEVYGVYSIIMVCSLEHTILYRQYFHVHHRNNRRLLLFKLEQKKILRVVLHASVVITRDSNGHFTFLELYCVLVCCRIVRALYFLLLFSS